MNKDSTCRHFHNAVWDIGRTNSELAVQLMDLFQEEGGRQRDIVCYSHDKPRHTARVVQIMEGVLIGTLHSIHKQR